MTTKRKPERNIRRTARPKHGDDGEPKNTGQEVLVRLQAAGAAGVGLADVIDLTTAAGSLRGWIEEMRHVGWIIARHVGPGGAPRYRLVGRRRPPKGRGHPTGESRSRNSDSEGLEATAWAG